MCEVNRCDTQNSLCSRAGTSQFEPQSAGLAPNGKLGSMYGGMYNFNNINSFKSLLTRETSQIKNNVHISVYVTLS